MEEKYYDDNVLSNVEGLLSEADNFLNDAKGQVDSAFSGLNSETRTATSKPIIPSAQPDLAEAYEFANDMHELNSKLGASRLDLQSDNLSQSFKDSDLSISSETSSLSEINFEEIFGQFTDMSEQEFFDFVDSDAVPNEFKDLLKELFSKGNYEAILQIYVILEIDGEISSLNQEKADNNARINEINTELLSISGPDYEIKKAALIEERTSLEARNTEIDAQIESLNIERNQKENDLAYTIYCKPAYNALDSGLYQSTNSLESFLEYCQNNNINENEAFDRDPHYVLEQYFKFLSQSPEHGKGYNNTEIIVYLLQKFPDDRLSMASIIDDAYQMVHIPDPKTGEIYYIDGSVRSSMINTIGTVGVYYNYMTTEDIKAYDYIYQTEGEDAAYKFFKVLAVEKLNRLYGADLAKQSAIDIANAPLGNVGQILTAGIHGIPSGIIERLEDIGSWFTGNGSYTVNDYYQMYLKTTLVMADSCNQKLTENDLNNMAAAGQITKEQQSQLLAQIKNGNLTLLDLMTETGKISENDANTIQYLIDNDIKGKITASSFDVGTLIGGRLVDTAFTWGVGGLAGSQLVASLGLSQNTINTWSTVLNEAYKLIANSGDIYQNLVNSGAIAEGDIASASASYLSSSSNWMRYISEACLLGTGKTVLEYIFGGQPGFSLSGNIPEDASFWKKLELMLVVNPAKDALVAGGTNAIASTIDAVIKNQPIDLDALGDKASGALKVAVKTYIAAALSNPVKYGGDSILFKKGANTIKVSADIIVNYIENGDVNSDDLLSNIEEMFDDYDSTSDYNGELDNFDFDDII